MFTQMLIGLAITAVLLLVTLLVLTFVASKRAQQVRSIEIIVLRSAIFSDDDIWNALSELTNSLMQQANANFSIVGSEFYDGYKIEKPDFVLVATPDTNNLFAKLLPYLGDNIKLIATPDTITEANIMAQLAPSEIISGSIATITEKVKSLV